MVRKLFEGFSLAPTFPLPMKTPKELPKMQLFSVAVFIVPNILQNLVYIQNFCLQITAEIFQTSIAFVLNILLESGIPFFLKTFFLLLVSQKGPFLDSETVCFACFFVIAFTVKMLEFCGLLFKRLLGWEMHFFI